MTQLRNALERRSPAPTSLAQRLAQGARAVIDARPGHSVSPVLEVPSPAKLMQIIAKKDISSLQAALETGVGVNFMAVRSRMLLSPLAFSCEREWEEGTRLLLASGAQESAALATWAALTLPQQRALCGANCARKNVADFIQNARTFSMIVASEPVSQVDQRQRLFLAALPHTWGAQSIVEHAGVGQLNAQQRFTIEENLITQALDEPVRARLLSMLWEQAPKNLKLHETWRLAAILRQDAVETLEVWAQKAPLGAATELKVELFPRDFQRIQTRFSDCDFLPFPHIRRKNNNSIPSHLTHSEELVGLWLACILLDARRCLRALVATPELAQATLDDPRQKAWLCMAFSASALSEAQRQGVVLSECTNQSGENPLHFACASGESKNRILGLAKLCPQWIAQRDRQGRAPMDVMEPSADRAQLLARLEQLSLSIEMGLRDPSGKPRPKAKAKSGAGSEDSEASNAHSTPLKSKPRRI